MPTVHHRYLGWPLPLESPDRRQALQKSAQALRSFCLTHSILDLALPMRVTVGHRHYQDLSRNHCSEVRGVRFRVEILGEGASSTPSANACSCDVSPEYLALGMRSTTALPKPRARAGRVRSRRPSPPAPPPAPPRPHAPP